MSAWPSGHVTQEAEAAFQAWRRKATHVMLLVFAFTTLANIFAWLSAYALPNKVHWVGILLVLVALMVAGVSARRSPPILRVWLLLIVPYLASIHGLIFYSGDMARVWLLGLPVIALILAGPRSAVVAAFVSTGLIAVHSFLAWFGISDAWGVPGFDENRPVVVLARAVMWVTFFVPMLYLIRKVHLFHLLVLSAERATSAHLEQEVIQRRAAHEALARSAGEREALEREIARVGDEERRRLGQELHDGVNQQLAGALLRCTALEKSLAKHYPDGVADARELRLLLESAMDDVHEAAHCLSPVGLDPEALGPALAAMAHRAGHCFRLRCDYRQAGPVRMPDREKTLDLYRIAQEAVNNAGQHAQADRIAVTLARDDGHVLLTVADDGIGLPPELRSEGLGFRIMDFRAHRIGGSLSVEGGPEGGTRVVCRIPASAVDEQ